jgi:dCMP deaminase
MASSKLACIRKTFPLGEVMKVYLGPYKENRKEQIHIHDYDTWNMDDTLAMIIVPMLKQLKATKHGVEEVASWSKDPSRKIGAVAIGAKGQVLAQGFNGFPRGIDDSEERYNDRQRKYELVVHAEMNVIYNATYSGVSLDGATLYVSGLPVCSECAKGIVQVGIKHVIMRDMEIPDSWRESWHKTQEMFHEANIQFEFVK